VLKPICGPSPEREGSRVDSSGLDGGDTREFDLSFLTRQILDPEARTPRWIGRKVYEADIIHLGKIFNVRHQLLHLDDVVERCPAGCEDGLDMLEALAGLFFNNIFETPLQRPCAAK
jgi:hypothetical protein